MRILPALMRPTRWLPVAVAAIVGMATLLSACGSRRGSSLTTASRPSLESIFEAEQQLHADPVRTLETLRRLGVDRVRVYMGWNAIAPSARSRTRPARFDAANPAAYPAAGWTSYDTIVRDAQARGIGVDLTVGGPAPLWARGTDVPPRTPLNYAQVWKPSAKEFGQFVRAVASRYSGHYTPPGLTRPEPRVSFWSIWNEPNYGSDLAPQAIDYSTVEVSPNLYRGLLDAAWGALHQAGHGADTILFGESAPRGITTGDNPGNFSGMVPLRFLRALYCVDSSFHRLQGQAAAARGCPTRGSSGSFAAAHPVLFRASGFAAHLYPQGGLPPNFVIPDEPDYADLASLPSLEKALDRAVSAYGPARQLPVYSTEFGLQTNPPEKIIKTTTPANAAYYLNWAEYISWRDPRVRSWDQYLLTDPPSGSFASGLEFANGTPKPGFFAYRLPIYMPITSAKRGRALEVWGCVRPARYARFDTGRSQNAKIEFEATGTNAFRTIRTVPVGDRHGYLDLPVSFPSSGSVRISWSYPRGATIHSRTVSVTIGQG
jgi:hypothetical protein